MSPHFLNRFNELVYCRPAEDIHGTTSFYLQRMSIYQVDRMLITLGEICNWIWHQGLKSKPRILLIALLNGPCESIGVNMGIAMIAHGECECSVAPGLEFPCKFVV